MKKLLITSIGGDIGYSIIKAIRATSRELYIIGCDIKQYNASYDLVDEFFISPRYSEIDAWKECMISVIKEKKIDYFWPVTEQEIKNTNKNKQMFDSVKVVINKSSLLDIAMDKGKTAEFLESKGILIPKTWGTIPEGTITFPIIVKERFGCGSHSVILVKNREELEKSFTDMVNPIVQQYIGNKDEEYSMTVFSDGNVVNCIAFKRELGFGGMSRYVELIHDEILSEIAIKVSNAFGLRGSINIQMRKLKNEYYIFEINPRISSTMGFRRQLGFNDVAWWLDMLDNISVKKYVWPSKKYFGVRTVEEKIYNMME